MEAFGWWVVGLLTGWLRALGGQIIPMNLAEAAAPLMTQPQKSRGCYAILRSPKRSYFCPGPRGGDVGATSWRVVVGHTLEEPTGEIWLWPLWEMQPSVSPIHLDRGWGQCYDLLWGWSPPTNSSDLYSVQDNGPNSSYLLDMKDCIYLLFSQEMHRNTANEFQGGLLHIYDWMI